MKLAINSKQTLNCNYVRKGNLQSKCNLILYPPVHLCRFGIRLQSPEWLYTCIFICTFNTTLGTWQPITKQCLPGVGEKCAHALLCTAVCLQIEMRGCFACLVSFCVIVYLNRWFWLTPSIHLRIGWIGFVNQDIVYDYIYKSDLTGIGNRCLTNIDESLTEYA